MILDLWPPPLSQLEESNRTLTVDVANLAGEKEELNNQLKEMQQSTRGHHGILIPRRVCVFFSLRKRLTECFFSYFYRVAESQRGREANELPQSVF